MTCSSRPRRSRSLAVAPLLLLVVALASRSAARAQPAALGSEVTPDASPTAWVFCPELASRGDGGFAVAWPRFGATGATMLLRSAGAAAAFSPLRTVDDTHSISSQLEGLAGTAFGYQMAWQRPTDATHFPHLVQRLDGTGAPLGAASTLARRNVAMSPRPVGGVIATWTTNGKLNVQRLDSRGVALGAPVAIRTIAIYPLVAHRRSGDFVVLWRTGHEARGDWVDGGVLAQRFSAAGRTVGRPFTAVPPTPGTSHTSVVASIGDDGTLAVLSAIENLSYGEMGFVTLRTYDASGALVGGPVAITGAADLPEAETYPFAVAVDGAGRVLAVWAYSESVYEPHALARLFARDGSPLGAAFAPASSASTATNPAFLCGAAAWTGGSWVVAWAGSTSPIDEEDTTGQTWVRRFAGD